MYVPNPALEECTVHADTTPLDNLSKNVVPGLLNYYTLTNVKQFYTFDDRCFYSYPNFVRKKNIKNITFTELNKYITN